MFREATEWSVLLQKTHVFMLPHTELVVFFANLNLKMGEQNRTRVWWHVISRSYRFLYFYHICCEFLWISIALWLFFLQGITLMKDNVHFLTLFFFFSSSRSPLQLKQEQLCGSWRWVRVRRESVVTVSGAQSFSDASECLPLQLMLLLLHSCACGPSRITPDMIISLQKH